MTDLNFTTLWLSGYVSSWSNGLAKPLYNSAANSNTWYEAIIDDSSSHPEVVSFQESPIKSVSHIQPDFRRQTAVGDAPDLVVLTNSTPIVGKSSELMELLIEDREEIRELNPLARADIYSQHDFFRWDQWLAAATDEACNYLPGRAKLDWLYEIVLPRIINMKRHLILNDRNREIHRQLRAMKLEFFYRNDERLAFRFKQENGQLVDPFRLLTTAIQQINPKAYMYDPMDNFIVLNFEQFIKFINNDVNYFQNESGLDQSIIRRLLNGRAISSETAVFVLQAADRIMKNHRLRLSKTQEN